MKKKKKQHIDTTYMDFVFPVITGPNLKAVKLFHSLFNYHKADLQQKHAEYPSV